MMIFIIKFANGQVLNKVADTFVARLLDDKSRVHVKHPKHEVWIKLPEAKIES